MTVADAIQLASAQILRRDAETLLLHVLKRDRAFLLAHPEAHVAAEPFARFQNLVARRAAHWPLQYLTTRQEFFGLELLVTPDTLIPRPETEQLVEAVLAWVNSSAEHGEGGAGLRIVDVGTGTGAIAVALAHSLPSARVLALDISPVVRSVVQHNAVRHGVANQVTFLESNLLDGLAERIVSGERCDILVSNPPYVPLGDAPSMQPEVRDFEPHLALFAGEDGVEIYRRLIPQALTALRPGGLLAMEFGFGQQPALAALLCDWRHVRFQQDYAGIPRLVLGERP